MTGPDLLLFFFCVLHIVSAEGPKPPATGNRHRQPVQVRMNQEGVCSGKKKPMVRTPEAFVKVMPVPASMEKRPASEWSPIILMKSQQKLQ